MFFKFKDFGVILKYQGVDIMQFGQVLDVLQLIFEEVGDILQNKYLVWVDQDEYLVWQWVYFCDVVDEVLGFVVLW